MAMAMIAGRILWSAFACRDEIREGGTAPQKGDLAGMQTQGPLSQGEQMKIVVEKFGGPGTYRTYRI
jgi:hypothetical protein